MIKNALGMNFESYVTRSLLLNDNENLSKTDSVDEIFYFDLAIHI